MESSSNENKLVEDSIISGDETDSYRVQRPIGKGKFAVVYRGERMSDGETSLL